jgi:hypothetical protein
MSLVNAGVREPCLGPSRHRALSFFPFMLRYKENVRIYKTQHPLLPPAYRETTLLSSFAKGVLMSELRSAAMWYSKKSADAALNLAPIRNHIMFIVRSLIHHQPQIIFRLMIQFLARVGLLIFIFKLGCRNLGLGTRRRALNWTMTVDFSHADEAIESVLKSTDIHYFFASLWPLFLVLLLLSSRVCFLRTVHALNGMHVLTAHGTGELTVMSDYTRSFIGAAKTQVTSAVNAVGHVQARDRSANGSVFETNDTGRDPRVILAFVQRRTLNNR